MTLTYQERQRMKDLGTFLKATRNCFYFSDRHDSYIRMRSLDDKNEFFEVESCPASEIPNIAKCEGKGKRKGRLYVDLGDEEGRRAVFQSLPFTRKDTDSYRIWKLQLVEDKLQVVK